MQKQLTNEQEARALARRVKARAERLEGMKREATKVARWKKNGERGERPATPLLDQAEARMARRAS